MTVSLLLPETDYVPREHEQVIALPDMSLESEPSRLAARFVAQRPAPDRVVGSKRTPVLAWVLAAWWA